GLHDLALGLAQLVLAEVDVERADHGDRDHGNPGQHLLRTSERLEVDPGHLAVEPERLLARPDRGGVVLAGPAANVHDGSLSGPAVILPPMAAGQVIDQEREAREAFAG